MTEIVIYTTQVCPYCVRAKNLLKEKGQEWKEINISSDQDAMEEMIKKSGGKRSVPQIFIDGAHIGGCDELYELNARGQLDKLLGSDHAPSR